MQLSKRTEYGLRAVIQLAKLWPAQFVQSRDLATQEKLPNKFLESILLALRRGGFLESKVGSGGGYRLSRAPRDILIGDVLRRLEGKLSNNTPRTPNADNTPGEIAVQLVNRELTAATDQALGSMTLEQLVDQVNREAGATQEMYYI